jgi:hypothetical protein
VTKRGLVRAEPTRKSSVGVTTADGLVFTTAELERMLDWYRTLPLCHDVVPRDDELARKIALKLAELRTMSAALRGLG